MIVGSRSGHHEAGRGYDHTLLTLPTLGADLSGNGHELRREGEVSEVFDGVEKWNARNTTCFLVFCRDPAVLTCGGRK